MSLGYCLISRKKLAPFVRGIETQIWPLVAICVCAGVAQNTGAARFVAVCTLKATPVFGQQTRTLAPDRAMVMYGGVELMIDKI